MRATLPNFPLFAAPFAGMAKLVKDWPKWAYISPPTPASACANSICMSAPSGFAIWQVSKHHISVHYRVRIDDD